MRFVSIALAICALIASIPSAVAQTPQIFNQSPCPLQSGFCTQLDANASDFVVREFQFTAPKPGKALVTFNGSMLCIAYTAPLAFELISQIVPAGATAAENGPSSNRLGSSIATAGGTSVNLGSSRAITYRKAGSYKVAFAIKKVALFPNTTCVVSTAAFTVLYFPDR